MDIIKLIDSVVTRSLLTQLIYATTIYICIALATATATATDQELLRGFETTPDLSISSFQPLLNDSTGNYSLGLLRVDSDQLALSVLHVASSESLWSATTTRPAKWAHTTRVFFNGSLVISDPRSGVFWSTHTDGDRVWLSDSSDLQIQKVDSVIWRSFDFPTNTLLENQNFTSAMALVSSNGLYSMKLGSDFWGLYAKFGQKSGPDPNQLFYKHKALQAKKDIVEGQGPVYLVLKPDGFLGMYQNGTVPVDVEAFNSFNRPNQTGTGRIRIEPDGNLKGYYWTGSSWVLDYQAITDTCELPSACGPYGLCQPGTGCSCIDNRTEYTSGDRCVSPDRNSGDFCGIENSKYNVLRRNGLALPYKELMGYEQMGSWAQCVDTCEKDCTCWGVTYTNTSGFCYRLEYPIETLVSVGDDSRMGYFKVREGVAKKRWVGVGIGILCGGILVIGGLLGVIWYKAWMRRRGVRGYVEEEGGVSVGPYKDLGAASFRSLELVEKR